MIERARIPRGDRGRPAHAALAATALAAALLAVALPAAEAKPRPRSAVPQAVPRDDPAPAAPACVPDCPNDRSPCDPPAFKHADARCNRNI